jgi:hypothetical protein
VPVEWQGPRPGREQLEVVVVPAAVQATAGRQVVVAALGS